MSLNFNCKSATPLSIGLSVRRFEPLKQVVMSLIFISFVWKKNRLEGKFKFPRDSLTKINND